MRNSDAKLYFDRWLDLLGVSDAWRLHHPSKKFTVAQHRVSTSLTIFLDETLSDDHDSAAPYFVTPIWW